MIDRLNSGVRTSLVFFIRPLPILRSYQRAYLRPDLIAGLTVAVILLPQAIAYALIAGLPAQLGLYTAIIAAAIGALWGSSYQLHTGPTNTASILVLTTLLPIAAVGTPKYLVAASVLAVMIGVFRLLLGLARLGMLVNFVSDSVIIGFTAGAGVLIWVSEMVHVLRLNIPKTPSMVVTLEHIIGQIGEAHWQSLILAMSVGALIVIVRRFNRKLPGALIALILAATIVWIFNLENYGIKVLGCPGRTPSANRFFPGQSGYDRPAFQRRLSDWSHRSGRSDVGGPVGRQPDRPASG
jgi:sulfate permease, SulP family